MDLRHQSNAKYVFNPESKLFELNLPQLLTVLAPQPDKFLEAGRGTGKSTIIAWQKKEVVHNMPRSANVIVGETYQQILTRTLPSTISALTKLGYKKDLHYFIGRKPPKTWKWNEPHEPPLRYDYFIIWYTGAGYHLVSQDRAGSGRGLNTDSVIGDEAALLDYDRLFQDVLATNRGGVGRYPKTNLHHSTFFTSTIPTTDKGKWMYRMEEEAKKNPKDVFYLRASAEENRKNLGDKWFRDNKRILTPLMYSLEIENIRPETIEGGFYPSYNERQHTYTDYDYAYLEGLDYDFDKLSEVDCRQDRDMIHDKPFDIALDNGGKINTLVIGQEHPNAFKIINAMYAQEPLLISDLASDFCDYYHPKRVKEVNYYYDHTAIPTQGIVQTDYAQEFAKVLRGRGWKVNLKYIGRTQFHHIKHLVLNQALKGGDSRIPPLLFNRHNCKYLIISMKLAPMKQGPKGFEKEKLSERRNGDQREATHFSDAWDTLIIGKYGSKMNHSTSSGMMDTIFG